MAEANPVARYIGTGAYVQGIPRRDLTAADWARLAEGQRARVRDGGLYRMVGGRADKIERAEQQQQDDGAADSPPTEGGD